MKYFVELTDSANDDLLEISVYYNESNFKIADDFILGVEKTLLQISSTPFIYQEIYNCTRRASVGHFPYGIFYIIDDEKIVVFAVIHEKRSPNIWQKRITNH